MAVEFKETTEYKFDHIKVQKRMTEGVQNGWRISARKGYVIYDTAASDVEFAPDTMEEIPVTYYRRSIDRPMSFSFESFTWAAVPETDVDPAYIK